MTESAVLPAGVYRLETAVVDLEGQRASVRTRDFEIAEPAAGLAMSDIVLVRRTVEDSAAGETDSPFRYFGNLVVPTLDHSIASGSKIPLFLIVYPDAKIGQKPQVTFELLRGTESVFELQPDTPDSAPGKPLQIYFTAPTDGLDAGPCRLRVTVKQSDGQITKLTEVQIGQR